MMAGMDQFGGLNTADAVLAGYRIGVERVGQEKADQMVNASVKRILINQFRLGLFEDPYLKEEESLAVHKNSTYKQRSRLAQKNQ